MKKKLAAAGTAILAVAVGMFSTSSKTAPTFTSIYPLAVAQGLDQAVTITGSGFAKNTSLVVNGTSYALHVNSPTSASFTFSPSMTQTVGFLPVQVKTANLASQTLYFQVCAPLDEADPVIIEDGSGSIRLTSGCLWPVNGQWVLQP